MKDLTKDLTDREKLEKIQDVFVMRGGLDDLEKLELIERILKINKTTQDDKEDIKEIEKILLGRKWRLINSGYPNGDKLKMILEVLRNNSTLPYFNP